MPSMMRVVSRILFVLVLFFPSAAFAQKDFASILSTYSPALVRVVSFNSEGKKLSTANGFLLNGAGEVVTTYHALRGAASAMVHMSDGRVLPVEGVLVEDVDHDLALVTTGKKDSASLSLPPVPYVPVLGKLAILISSPQVSDQSILYGTVTEVRDLPGIARIFRIDTSAHTPSGSLVVSANGEIIGVTISYGGDFNGRSYAVSTEVVGIIKSAGSLAEVRSLGTDAGVETDPARDLFSIGMQYVLEGRFKAALPFFSGSVDADPSFPSPWFMLGECYSRTRSFHLASEANQQALRLRPDVAKAHYHLGNAYGKLRCFQDAAESYEKAIALEPDDVNTWFRLAMAYDRLGWEAEAEGTFSRALCFRNDTLPDGAESCPDIAEDRMEELLRAYMRQDWTDNLFADEHFQKGLTYLMLARRQLALQEFEVLKKVDARKAASLFEMISP